MSGVKSAIRKIKYHLKHDFLSIENVVLLFAIVMCLMWTYQSIEAMSRNWELVERLNADRKALELLEIEVETAELQNEYYASDQIYGYTDSCRRDGIHPDGHEAPRHMSP